MNRQHRRGGQHASGSDRRMPAGGLLVQSGAEPLRRFSGASRRGAPGGAAWHRHLSRRRARRPRAAPRRRDRAGLWRVACSAGPLAADSFARLSGELLEALQAEAAGAIAVYFALHGAMQAEDELDPEGRILEQARAIDRPRGAVRDVARPARHRDRADVQALPGVHGAAHLSACRLCRHGRARRKAPAADSGRGAAARGGAGLDAASGARRRADHGDRPLWRLPQACRGDRARARRAVDRPVHRQSVHRRARARLAGRGGHGRRCRTRPAEGARAGGGVLRPARRHAGEAGAARARYRRRHRERRPGDPDRRGRCAELGRHRRQPGHRRSIAGARLSPGIFWRH